MRWLATTDALVLVAAAAAAVAHAGWLLAGGAGLVPLLTGPVLAAAAGHFGSSRRPARRRWAPAAGLKRAPG